jgi:hypothetical protein
VTVTGTAGTSYVLTQGGSLANMPVPTVTVDGTLLTGSSPTITATHTTTGRSAGTYAKYSGATATAPAAGPTVAGNGSGSAFGAGTYLVSYTIVNAQGETTPSPATAVTITAAQNLRVSAISSLPASATSVRFYVNGVRAGSQTVTSGTAAQTDIAGITGSGQPPSTNTAYTIPNGAGSQSAKCLLKYPCQTDAAGMVSFSSTNAQGEWLETTDPNVAFFTGVFRCEDLTGLDDAAVAALGRLWQGTSTTGQLKLN